ncbi:MAG TPA: stage II sporulation protein M [Steroidobacteraceae bacterium]|nr:stage II sporulation protein M [Steroidobacteraceae bacterium]
MTPAPRTPSWLAQRAAIWGRLGDSLLTWRRGRLSRQDALKALEGYRGLARDVASARKSLPGSPITAALETLYSSLHAVVNREPRHTRASLRHLYAVEIPATVQELKPYILGVWFLFALSTAAGWGLIHTWPTLVGLVASPEMVRHVEHGELWTNGILNITPSSLLSIRIFTNNIAVTIFACVAGIFYGLGTFYVIANNGLMLGGVFAFTQIHGLDGDLLKFIFAHGTVELSMICLGGAAGVALGESLIRPRLASRRDSLQQCTAKIARLFAALIPLLIICGIIEGFVSPDPDIGWPVRLVVGLANLSLMYAVLSGRFFRSAAAA